MGKKRGKVGMKQANEGAVAGNALRKTPGKRKAGEKLSRLSQKLA
jgi:hypothetical protein